MWCKVILIQKNNLQMCYLNNVMLYCQSLDIQFTVFLQ